MKKAAKRRVKLLKKPNNLFLLVILALLVFCGVVVYVVIYGSPARLPKAETRDPLSWPFDKYSIWNVPIGSKAVYQSIGFQTPNAGYGFDNSVIIMSPNSPLRDVYINGAWPASCSLGSKQSLQVPVPDGFLSTIALSGEDQPNLAGAILLADGKTVVQGQPTTRCGATSPITMSWLRDKDNILGNGDSCTGETYQAPKCPSSSQLIGGHGGSAMSSLGGAIRKGEAGSANPIRHALQLIIDCQKYCTTESLPNGGQGWRWPAITADSYAVGGANAYGRLGRATVGLGMGSLLAIPSSVNVDTLGISSESVKKIVHALQDYGGYVVDDAYDPGSWENPRIGVELGAAGEIDSSTYASDMDKVFKVLQLVTNNAPDIIGGCAFSDTTCTRRQPYAPDFGQTVANPTPTPTPIASNLPTPTPTPVPPIIGTEIFKEDFFNNKTLSNTPIATVTTKIINNNWGMAAPYSGVPTDNFSIRWTGIFNFDGSKYRFNASADDGIRVKVDGQTLIDGWKNQATTTYNKISTLTGAHTVTVEYFDSGWDAVAKVNWVHADKCFDMTGDGKVDDADLKVVSDHFSSSKSNSVAAWDLNNDSKVNSLDQLMVVKQKGTTCN